MKKKIIVILTCHNRQNMTVKCIEKLYCNKTVEASFIVVDDSSTDGTAEAIGKLQNSGMDIKLILGSGALFWSGGMRSGIKYAKENTTADYYLLVNDDVDFREYSLDKIMEQVSDEFVFVGATCNQRHQLTYGGIKYNHKGIEYTMAGPEYKGSCDTFNANCVVIPRNIFNNVENIDPYYIHSLGDFDYGLSVSRSGYQIKMLPEYVGFCEDNTTKGTWHDTTLSLVKRWNMKESVKGDPFRQWFYFLNKNFGLSQALLHGFTPYIRIILRK